MFRFLGTGSGNMDLVVDWGDGAVDTIHDNSPGDTVRTSHAWADSGDYDVRAMAMLTEKNRVSTYWSYPHGIEILPNGSPTAGFEGPPQAPVDVSIVFTVWGRDPDGENVSLRMRFGDDNSDWSDYVAAEEPVTTTHEFKDIGETLWVSAQTRDIHRAPGPWSDSVQVVTTEAGGMLWWWVTPNEDSAAPSTATVVAEYDGTEYVYFGTEDEYCFIHSVDVTTGKRRFSGTSLFPESECGEWSNHPAYNENTGHILIANEDGELYAFDRELNRVWTFPGATSPEYLTFTEWGHVCVADNSIYISNIDTIIRGGDTIRNVTKFYKIPDGPERPVEPPFAVIGVQEVLGAPVADASGNVFFVTDSGNLFKMNSNLQVQWQRRITERRYIYGPVVGAGGVVFCGDDEGKVYAYNPDGTPKWTATLAGVWEMCLVVGRQHLFAACDDGHVYALDPGTGTEVWDRHVSTEASIEDYLILTRNGNMYVANDNTKLFCVEQATGEKLWDIACTDYYPGGARARKVGIDEPPPPPTLTATGNIVVVSEDAMYCVSGYRDGPLDTDAPWPKWQHDLHNTGCAGW